MFPQVNRKRAELSAAFLGSIVLMFLVVAVGVIIASNLFSVKAIIDTELTDKRFKLCVLEKQKAFTASFDDSDNDGAPDSCDFCPDGHQYLNDCDLDGMPDVCDIYPLNAKENCCKTCDPNGPFSEFACPPGYTSTT